MVGASHLSAVETSVGSNKQHQHPGSEIRLGVSGRRHPADAYSGLTDCLSGTACNFVACRRPLGIASGIILFTNDLPHSISHLATAVRGGSSAIGVAICAKSSSG